MGTRALRGPISLECWSSENESAFVLYDIAGFVRAVWILKGILDVLSMAWFRKLSSQPQDVGKFDGGCKLPQSIQEYTLWSGPRLSRAEEAELTSSIAAPVHDPGVPLLGPPPVLGATDWANKVDWSTSPGPSLTRGVVAGRRDLAVVRLGSLSYLQANPRSSHRRQGASSEHLALLVRQGTQDFLRLDILAELQTTLVRPIVPRNWHRALASTILLPRRCKSKKGANNGAVVSARRGVPTNQRPSYSRRRRRQGRTH